MRSILMAAFCVFALAGISAAEADKSKADDAAATLIKKLDSEEFAEREKAQQALVKLGKNVVETLRKALEETKDAEVKSRIQHVLDELTAPLAMTIEIEGEPKAGQPLKFKVRIKNISGKEQVVAKCLDGSARGKRYPHYSRSITPDLEAKVSKAGCGNCNELGTADLVTLKPGEELDPFGPGSFGTWLADWTPPKEGTYSAVFVCDFAAKDLLLWNGPIERQGGLGEAESLLAKVPKVRLEAKTEVKVKP